jgi:hypothetical protein
MRRTVFLLGVVVITLLTVPVSSAQSFQYADDCIVNVDNATTILPSTIDPDLPNGASLAPDDTVAIRNGDGDCVGYGAWADDGAPLVVAAAGPTVIDEAESGLQSGDALRWEVYDVSAGTVVPLGTNVQYASCDSEAVPTCRSDGSYADGALLEVKSLQVPAYALNVMGTDGTGNDGGWRMMAFPAAEATRAALEDDIDFSVTSQKTLYLWGDGAWSPKQSSTDALPRGKGFILYLFDDSQNTLDTDGLEIDVDRGSENTSTDATVDELDQQQEWHLLGNPFPGTFDLGSLAGGDLASAGFQATVQVWDPDLGRYQQILQGTTGDDVAAWQGFFVQRSTPGTGQTSLTFGADGYGTGGAQLIGSKSRVLASADQERTKLQSASSSWPSGIALELAFTNSKGDTLNTDEVTYWMDRRAALGYDAYEAEDLSPPSGGGFATATLPISKRAELVHRALGAAPPPVTGTAFERVVPLSVRGVGASGTATLAWPDRVENSIPDEWTVQLRDTKTDSTVDLRQRRYTFSVQEGKTLTRPDDARFRLKVASPQNVSLASLSRFDGKAEREQVNLQWETTAEENNDGFRVERRITKNGGGWRKIGFIEGAGTVSTPQEYEYTDKDLPYATDTLRYRLRQVGAKGAKSYSKPLVLVREGVDDVKLLGTYPNPASSQATVRYALPEDRDADASVRLRLYDLMGRRVRSLRVRTEPGRHERQLDVSGLASGVYVLRLQAGGTFKTTKVTVVH